MILSPNDSKLIDSASDMKDQNFGGNRAITTGVQQKEQDYKQPVGWSSSVKENPVDKVIKDIDDMTDSNVRKREFSRRDETNNHSDHNKERFHESEPDNRPLEDTDVTQVPDERHRRSKLKNHFGEGQYEGEIS